MLVLAADCTRLGENIPVSAAKAVLAADGQGAIPNGARAIFTALAVAGPLRTLTVSSGNNQSVAAGATTQPLVVKAVDEYGNPIPDLRVTWTTSAGSISSSISTTNEAELASVSLTTVGSVASYQVTARAESVSAVFTARLN